VEPDPHPLRARLQILAAAVLFSTGGAAIKATTLDGWQVASFRSGIAAIAVFLMLPHARRRPTPRIALVSIAYAATLVLFVLATKNTTAANAIFLQSTAPIYVVLLSPWLLREPARRRDLLFLLILAAGMSLFFVARESPQATAPAPLFGNLMALLSGLAWAFTLVGLRAVGRREGEGGPGGASAVLFGNLVAFVAALPWALPVTHAAPSDALAILYLGVVQIGVAYACLTAALRHVGAMAATLLLFVEPALNPIGAWLAHGERVAPQALCGGLVILAATFVKTALDLRPPREAARD
jgi:drug/metabolite transporter (DMT)-like permease